MKRTLSCLLILALLLSLFTFSASAARSITTTPTGYNSADDVDYVTGTSKKWIANWGARGENCTFLSTYAQSYYTGSYSYDTLAQNDGGTSTSNAYKSDLYSALKSMMTAKHSYINNYDATKSMYAYTDCVLSDTSKLSSFYSGSMVNSAWSSGGKTYNREHTWPNSKGLGGSDENDIMMLRPTIPSENGSRGNKAYGESSGFFDPGVDVRGDCARIALYVYTRWGNTGYMWGSSGVIESLDILLEWMEEDPVDTWEMGRNDSVQSITGVRNAFVDYPELAWLLFGEEVPSGLSTPSGGTGSGSSTSCTHASTEIRNASTATCTADGYTGDTYCTGCGKKLSSGSTITATGHKDLNGDNKCDSCSAAMDTSANTGTHFVKVTTAPSDWSGTYLIVYEEGSLALDGTLGKLDAVGNNIQVTIRNGTIDIDTKYAFVIEAVSGGYTIKSSGGYYIGHTGSSNALTSSQSDKLVNTLSVNSEGSIDIVSGGFYLRFNANDDQTRFRYYKPTTYANQQPVTLYKLTSGETACTHSWGTGTVTTQPDCETAGLRTYTCAVCKQTKTETIAATGHTAETRNQKNATCITAGYTGDSYCTDCGKKLSTGSSIAATGHSDANKDNTCDACKAKLSSDCIHPNVATNGAKAPTCTAEGYTGDTCCEVCDAELSAGTVIPATGHTDSDGDLRCDTCGEDMNAPTEGSSEPPTEESVPPTTEGTITTVPATGPATVPSEDIPPMNTGSDTDTPGYVVWIAIGSILLLGGIAVFIIVKKKKATEE